MLPGDAQIVFTMPPPSAPAERAATITMGFLGEDGQLTEHRRVEQLTPSEEMLITSVVKVISARCGPRSS